MWVGPPGSLWGFAWTLAIAIDSLLVSGPPGAMNESEWAELAEDLIRLAALAPSSHNTQPWVFSRTEHGIDLSADRARALPVNDPEDRELLISCGCALLNLRAAAAANGVGFKVEVFPEATPPDLLARLTIVDDGTPESGLSELAASISNRRTYRKPFDVRPVTGGMIRDLSAAAAVEGSRLHPITDEATRKQVAQLVVDGDAAQWRDKHWRRELAGWMRPRSEGDGLTVPGFFAPIARRVVRSLDLGKAVGKRNRNLAERAPLLAVLATDHDDPTSWLATGQALQRLLLVGCRSGVQMSYLNQPIQVLTVRPALQALLDVGVPQVLLRAGFPTVEAPPAPRRDLDAILVSSTSIAGRAPATPRTRPRTGGAGKPPSP